MALDRAYFRNKNKPKKDRKKSAIITKCCNTDITDREPLNKNKPEEWELIEEHCERHLFDYPSTETIDPVCCEECGRLQEYVCILNEKAYKG